MTDLPPQLGMTTLQLKLVVLMIHMVEILYCDDWHFQGENVASGKPAYQYPLTLDDHVAGLAVDGDTGSCACTDAQQVNAWWRVDLKQNITIKGIRIFTKNGIVSDAKRGELKGFNITGSSDSSGRVQLYSDVTARDHQYREQVINITVTATSTFSGIKVVVPAHPTTRSILSLCEVQVFPLAAVGRHDDFHAKAVSAIMGTIGGAFVLGAVVVILIIFVNRIRILSEMIRQLTGLRVFRRVFPVEPTAPTAPTGA